jgi:hypothetical protein
VLLLSLQPPLDQQVPLGIVFFLVPEAWMCWGYLNGIDYIDYI